MACIKVAHCSLWRLGGVLVLLSQTMTLHKWGSCMTLVRMCFFFQQDRKPVQ